MSNYFNWPSLRQSLPNQIGYEDRKSFGAIEAYSFQTRTVARQPMVTNATKQEQAGLIQNGTQAAEGYEKGESSLGIITTPIEWALLWPCFISVPILEEASLLCCRWQSFHRLSAQE